MAVMTFGKHEGEDLEEVPSAYLRRVLDNCNTKENEPLILAIEAEIKDRDKHRCHF